MESQGTKGDLEAALKKEKLPFWCSSVELGQPSASGTDRGPSLKPWISARLRTKPNSAARITRGFGPAGKSRGPRGTHPPAQQEAQTAPCLPPRRPQLHVPPASLAPKRLSQPRAGRAAVCAAPGLPASLRQWLLRLRAQFRSLVLLLPKHSGFGSVHLLRFTLRRMRA